MAEYRGRARRTSMNMPPYRAVLAVDVEKYSRTTSMHQQLLSNTVRDALEQAFISSGLEEVWRNASFPQSTGDGYLVGVPTEYLPQLIHPVLTELQDVLEDMQPTLAFEDRTLQLRLRAAIGLGPLPDTGGIERGDGIGDAMNETHRVLDSPAVRAALADSDPDMTFVAAGLTARAYEDAVLGGYVGIKSRRFHAAEVDLPDKQFHAQTWIYTPHQSQRRDDPPASPGKGIRQEEQSLDPTLRAPEDVVQSSPGQAAPAASGLPTVTNTINGSARSAFQGGTFNGDIHVGDSQDRSRRGGVGSVQGDVGNVVTDAQGPVNIGGRQYNDHADDRHRDSDQDDAE